MPESDENPKVTNSKSFADLIMSLLEDWTKFGRFVLLTLFICLVLFGMVEGVFHSLPRNTQQLNFETGSILFSQETSDGREYLVVIPPQGWEETAIEVRQGDHVRIESSGKVNIDLSGLNAALARRRELEARVTKENPAAVGITVSPEDLYKPEDWESIRPKWPWTGPDGISNEQTEKLAMPPRLKRRIYLKAGYGALLGAISPTGIKPTQERAFFIGSHYEDSAGHDGKLYFAVNDVAFDGSDFPDMFLADNIGFFYAKVSVSK